MHYLKQFQFEVKLWFIFLNKISNIISVLSIKKYTKSIHIVVLNLFKNNNSQNRL